MGRGRKERKEGGARERETESETEIETETEYLWYNSPKADRSQTCKSKYFSQTGFFSVWLKFQIIRTKIKQERTFPVPDGLSLSEKLTKWE